MQRNVLFAFLQNIFLDGKMYLQVNISKEGLEMIVKTRKQGNSITMTVPKEFHISAGTQLEPELREGGIFYRFISPNLDEESKKAMIRTLAIEYGIIEDTDRDVDDLEAYWKELGI
jgi:antitoxin component of MazEF toxin-antitoxin module